MRPHSLAAVVLTVTVGCTSVLDIDGFDYGAGGGASDGGSGGTGGNSVGPGAAGPGGAGGNPTGMGGSPAGGMGGTGGMGGAGGTGGGGPVGFLDDFNRADDIALGNGWLEKRADVFSLVGNQIIKEISGPGFNDNVVYRPDAEALRDVEASMEFELTTNTTDRPQIFVRGQFDSITTSGGYVAYKIWMNGGANEATLARQQIAGGSEQLGELDLAPGLTPGTRYRLRLRAVGANPVQLQAWVEEYDGSWMVLDTVTATDTDSAQITTAGVPGFAGDSGTEYFCENYAYAPL